MARLIIIAGILLVLIGLLWPILAKLGLGKLPGDILVEGERSKFFFPIVSCVVVSLVVSIVIWIIQR